MPEHLIVAKFPVMNGIARDTVQFDFAFHNDTGSAATNVQSFFNTKPTGATFSVAAWLSPWLNRGTNIAFLETYDLTAFNGGTGGLGPPIVQQFWTLGPTSQSAGPQQLCCVLSTHANDGSIPEHGPKTRPKARYRGRIFLGPLGTTAQSISGGNKCVVNSLLQTDLKLAAAALLTAEPTWGVWSRKDKIVRPIVGGWIDDTLDTQRRRSTDPVARLNWP
jgi:hypothetical protein